MYFSSSCAQILGLDAGVLRPMTSLKSPTVSQIVAYTMLMTVSRSRERKPKVEPKSEKKQETASWSF